MRPNAIAFAVLVSCAAAPLALVRVEREAMASVAIAITWDDLLRGSSAAAVVTPVESTAVWENGRIRTYTRMHVDRSVAGELPGGGEVWVRTLGGVVGNIGQLVDGEPVFVAGHPSLLFLRASAPGALEVTARGQGQFPVVASSTNGSPHVVRSRVAGALIEPWLAASSAANRFAADVIHDRTVDDVVVDVTADWARTHAK